MQKRSIEGQTAHALFPPLNFEGEPPSANSFSHGERREDTPPSYSIMPAASFSLARLLPVLDSVFPMGNLGLPEPTSLGHDAAALQNPQVVKNLSNKMGLVTKLLMQPQIVQTPCEARHL